MKFARETRFIDVIIGGHTHTLLKEPIKVMNIENKEVLINQVGWGGINLGKIDFHFTQNGYKKEISGRSIFIKNKTKNA